jgi:hypothetical protein
MTIIDPTTDIGKLRLRVGDWGDITYLPDAVYQQTLTDTSNNLNRSAVICANYILALLTRSTRSKLAQIESYDNQEFEQYKEFLIMTVKDPAFMSYSPIPFGGSTDEVNPLIQFQKSWNAGYVSGTSSQEMYEYYTSVAPLPPGD